MTIEFIEYSQDIDIISTLAMGDYINTAAKDIV
jgi:hypothetical protein